MKVFPHVQTQMQGQMVSQGQVPSQGHMAPQEFPSMVQTQIPDNIPQTFDENIIQHNTTQQPQVQNIRILITRNILTSPSSY